MVHELCTLSYLSIPSIMESSICGEEKEPPSLFPPLDLLLTHNGLHDGIKATLRSVQVPGHWCLLDLLLLPQGMQELQTHK